MNYPNRQTGAALATALIFLVIITLLGLTSIRSTTVELRMAQNEQIRLDATEVSQAAIDNVLANNASTPVTLAVGNSNCYSAASLGTTYCSSNNPNLEAQFSDDMFTGHSHVTVERMGPEFRSIPRQNIENETTNGTSSQHFKGTLFAVTGGFDGSADGLGRAELQQGTLQYVRQTDGINN